MRRDEHTSGAPGGERDGGEPDGGAGGASGSEEDSTAAEAMAEEALDAVADLEAEDGEAGEEGAANAEAGAADGEGGARPAASQEEDPPGPDVPAPSVGVLRKAMAWAFEGEEVEESLLDAYAEHAHRLLDYNRKVNLTAILDPKEVAAKHYLDSWRLTQYMSFLGRRILDLGSGGGFPGLPLALAEPNASVCLVESSSKKAAFLKEAVEALGVRNCIVHDGRCEDLLLTERCDMVLARAVSSVRENVRTLRKVRHSLKEYVMLKGASWSREVRAGEREAERLGFHLSTVFEHELPGDMGKRGILVYLAPGGQGL